MSAERIAEFEAAIEEVMNESKRMGCNPVRFWKMVDQTGSVMEVCRGVMGIDEPMLTFNLLAERGRLDLSIEAVALKFQDIFSKEDIVRAASRLKKAGYEPR
ncbi:MAG: hypothetical protein OEV59_02580 [Deltaproteobacteria bacterium]|nr:hypothetical protein [Deltaproteobacteria bacterium]